MVRPNLEKERRLDSDASKLTFKTIAALIHPRIVGIVLLHSSRAEDRDSHEAASHLGVMTVTPCSRRSRTVFAAVAAFGPDLDGTIKYLAPLEAIQFSIDRPMPPSPPTTK